MRWIELLVLAHPEAVEPVSEAFAVFAANGVAIEEPYTLEDDGQRWRPIPGAAVSVRAYISEDDHAAAIVQRLAETCWHLAQIGEQFVGALQTRVVDDADWAEAWKDHFQVSRIGRRVVIKPTWRDLTAAALGMATIPPDVAVIELDPGMAFGTGTHPTTRLCLEALEDTVRIGDSVLDVGTGSGILAIGALKLGAAQALALDISAIAIRVARENVALNGLTEQIAVTHGSLGLGPDGQPLLIPPPPELDDDPLALLAVIRALTPARVVVANIIARVISELTPALLAATAPAGTLIASGIIAERGDEVQAALQAAGLQGIERRQEGDWLALIGTREA